MSKTKATVSSSMEDTKREAEEYGVPAEDARKIHDLIQANTSPDVVKAFEVKFDSDSTDSRAVWVILIVENDLKPSPEKISKLNREADKVRTALLREKFNFWPYVEVRGRLDSPSRSD
jgi:hypothetical protein